MQNREQQIQIINEWDRQKPKNLANTDHNVGLIRDYITAHVRQRGELSVDFLNKAVIELKDQLEFLAVQEMRGSREDRLMSLGIAPFTAHRNHADKDDRTKTDLEKFNKDARSAQRRIAFQKKMNEVHGVMEMSGARQNHGATKTTKKRMVAELAVRYPEYANLLPKEFAYLA